MTRDEAQTVWLKTRGPVVVTDALLREVSEGAHKFRAGLLVRDLLEVLGAILLTAYYVFMALRFEAGRAVFVYAAVMGIVPVIFIGVHRWVKREPQTSSETSREYVERARRQVQNQRWLLEHVQWWYLLPLGLSIALNIYATATFVAPGRDGLYSSALIITIGVLALVFVYYLNHYVSRTTLKSREDYLAELAKSLRENEGE
jgi:hypothetical protein